MCHLPCQVVADFSKLASCRPVSQRHRQTSQRYDETLHQAMDPSEYLLLFASNWDCAAHCSFVSLSTHCSCHVGHGGSTYDIPCLQKKTCLTCGCGCALGSKTRRRFSRSFRLKVSHFRGVFFFHVILAHRNGAFGAQVK